MNDLKLLTGSIAARLRALPEIQQLYPPRRAVLGHPLTGSGVLSALVEDPAVTAELDDDLVRIEVILAVDGRITTAPAAAQKVGAVITTELDRAGLDHRQVTVRVASIDI